MFRLYLPVLLLLLASLPIAAAAEVYQWKDAAGNTVFGDRPPRGQTRDLRRIQEELLQSPAAAAAEEAVFRERERRLLKAMARDQEERERLRAESAGAEKPQRTVPTRCDAVRGELEALFANAAGPGAEEAEREVSALRDFLTRQCGGEA